ncbi:aminotransferase class I/II-fold pyridoxal phosphate-dependent enzyme [Myxococcus sp. K15C18031901]|uniref:aminotransferase class I/II-fold pyridoxal phosphate-dependent enzyme n=1 Tax=Myxococcus dinghuensis TaxID=2906761 RepID=UPI0020A7611F|nr:aminotransferase class I/II-fold pyridoxal phosphate-dependent enzyme [Myxococcus dinghuensis]MCP3102430.1 aminotransferase class I/II-fold pyridoxal phosphate-dependent enzyme [Myxococcus dinghuensis]
MALAISSYAKLRTLQDDGGLLNLAWTLDEREFLTVDTAEVIRRELLDEANEPRFVNSYFVQDPYGEACLGPSIDGHFARAHEDRGVTCGAGVSGLLHALAKLTGHGPAYVIGDVYPDFPHWVGQLEARCVSRQDGRPGVDHVGNVRAMGATLVLVDHPALVGEDLDLEQLRELSDGVAPQGAVVLVDESYANYHPPSFSAINLVPQVENLAVLRGVSKAYWLGALRLGYCVASRRLSERIRAVTPPLQASSLSLRFARAVLDQGDITGPLRERVRSAKAEMLAAFSSAGLTARWTSRECLPYVFCDEGDVETRRDLERRGIIGKLQPFWGEASHAVTHRYRLSVPLNQTRMALLRQKMGAGHAR